MYEDVGISPHLYERGPLRLSDCTVKTQLYGESIVGSEK